MLVWNYIIQTTCGKIITQNPEYAEKKSRLGNIVYCRREKNMYKYNV